jgi:hypothetical protein
MVELLEQVWKKYPDWRLGQLIINASRDSNGNIRDPWFIEDSDMIGLLNRELRT